ncbi:hypothetical protein QBC39DRAFT_67746 [Podospora conica]|nr:hypothetical protein QBC39DRAFT_67746 [Schizothecium conicum]
MATVATRTTTGTILGSSVDFIPVPTPWPMSARCDEYIWRRSADGAVRAFDPNYPYVDGGRGQSCYPDPQSLWWFGRSVLGPTFVCPESYTSIHSTLVDGDFDALTQFTYCCPPSYTLNTILPWDASYPSKQCTSIVRPSTTIFFVTERRSTSSGFTFPSSTYTMYTYATETIYGIPVNGFNIVQQRQLDGTGTTGTTTVQPSATDDAGGGGTKVSGGVIAGAVVGGVAALVLLGLVFLFIRSWGRKRKAGAGVGSLPVARETPVMYFQASETPVQSQEHVVPVQNRWQRMSEQSQSHELPVQHPTRIHELPGHQNAPGGGGY